MSDKRLFHGFILVALALTLSCNLPFALGSSPTAAPAIPWAAPQSSAPPAPGSTSTPQASESPIATVQHTLTPVDAVPSGTLNYDVDSSGTGPEHRAPYGDSYNINLFERPFTQSDMTYLPQLDILTFQLSKDATWYYASIDLGGGDMNDPTGINYGVELDTNHDGFGDYLIWAKPPYTTTWQAGPVRVLQDTNHDTGGLSAEKSDAVFNGDGYDKIIFDGGQGADPDLAWVRLNPQRSAAVQFAFKRSLPGDSFMWGVWADSGLKDPSKFNYNDRFTEEQAGSPEKSEKYYPIKALYQVDNTCWPVVGFRATGDEPHLCPSLAPEPTKRKPAPTEVPSCPIGAVCN